MFKLIIPNWHPTPANRLIGCHYGTRSRLKRIDRNMITGYCLLNRLPVATGPRRVDLTITRGKSQRGKDPDPDAFWKSLNDALIHAKMLIDDSGRWVKLGDVTFERGEERITTITLTDLE